MLPEVALINPSLSPKLRAHSWIPSASPETHIVQGRGIAILLMDFSAFPIGGMCERLHHIWTLFPS